VHERRGYAANEDVIRVATSGCDREIDGLRYSLPLERKQGGDVDSVPAGVENAFVQAFDELHVVPLAVWPVILGDFHQPERWILVLIARLDEQDVLVGHGGASAVGATWIARPGWRSGTVGGPITYGVGVSLSFVPQGALNASPHGAKSL